MSSISKQILSFHLLLLVLGGALSGLVYISGNSISSTTASLVETDLPLLDNISKLRFAIFAQKPILYEYYANTDRDAFQKKFNDSKNIIKTGLYSLPRDEQGQSFLTAIEFQTGQIAHLAEQLDQTLSSSNIDWDKARDILVEVSATENKVTPLIDTFVSLNKKHVTNIGEQAKSRMQLIVQLVIGFIIVVFIFAILLGKNVTARLENK
jgi:predicted PurR-regulated permease PerM